VCLGNKHGIGVDNDKRVYGWGINLYGELLISEKVWISEPIKLSEEKVYWVAVQNSVSYLINE